MVYTKEKVLERLNARAITQFLSLAGIATIIPFFFHMQWVTGPLVNAILIIALFLIGIRSALVLCLVPSLMALAGGLLPAVLAPAIPFIMIGNVIYVLSVEFLYTKAKNVDNGFYISVLIGSFLKFLFLYFSVSFIVKLLVKQELVLKVAEMMSWTQFFTALTGGFIAFFILKKLKRI